MRLPPTPVAVLLSLLAASFAFADTLTVQQTGPVLNPVFDPAALQIRRGDTVKWIWNSGDHTVTSGTGFADPNTGALFDALLDFPNPTFHYTFSETSGTYPYYCIPHEVLGMVGTITVVEGDTHTVVTVDSTAFNPSTVFIRKGDTVKWVWTSLIHTVTSGFGSGDPFSGFFFDAPLFSGAPVFTYTFTDSLGTYPYFCLPHEFLGMTGTVVVEENPLVGVPQGGGNFREISWGRMKTYFR